METGYGTGQADAGEASELSDGAALMNGWAESITEGIYWFCAPNSGVFDASNPANWATEMPK